MLSEPQSHASRRTGEWLVSLPTVLIMLTVVFLGVGEYLHSQLLALGESRWEHYFILRADIAQPACNPDLNIDAEVRRLTEQAPAAPADELDLLAEAADPAAIRQSVTRSVEMCRAKWAIAQQNRERVTDGVRVYRFLETGVAELVRWVGQYKPILLCWLILICAAATTLSRHHIGLRGIQTRTDHYVAATAQLLAHALLLFSVLYYRAAEQRAAADGVQVQQFELHLWWALGFALLTAISLWQLAKPPPELSPGGSWAHALLAIPLYAYMAVIASLQFWILPATAHFIGAGAGAASVPHAPYYQGLGVYLAQMMELASQFLALALHVWIGMLLKQTRAAQLFFDLIRPWRLSPELMCFVVLAIAAWPTAYTAASGIFVIAAGTLLYQELLHSRARRGLALATTAMSGSLGVVLSPCLLVVIVAALDRRVTTAELFHHGISIYVLTLALFLLVAYLVRTEPARMASARVALPAMLRQLGPLVPYLVIIIAVIGVCTRLFNQPFNEYSAPYILPLILIAILGYEKSSARVADLSSAIVLVGVALGAYRLLAAPGEAARGGGLVDLALYALAAGLAIATFKLARSATGDDLPAPKAAPQTTTGTSFSLSLRAAATETTGHVGALLILMALSVSVGGMVERSNVMALFPQIENIWWTMAALVLVEVFIGMVMDPYGAVILVNATLAPLAYQAGIEPLHFWMLTLLAFELGYLTPPVALNHLLTRHLIGDSHVQGAVADAVAAGRGWWYRHERYLFPIAVMAPALLIVAYSPLAWQAFGWGAYLPDWLSAWLSYTRQ